MDLKCISSFVLLLPTVFIGLNAEEFTIKLESNGEAMAVIELSIHNDEAVSKVGEEIERFNLKNQSWLHSESNQWVPISQCESWAKQSREKSLTSQTSIPEEIRPFLLWSLDPTFKIEESDTTLTLTSGQVDYKITGKKTDQDLTNFFRYSRLNAYKKAIVERKLAPFSELKVLEELERRKIKPDQIEVKIPGIEGSPTIKMIYTEKAKPE